MATFWARWYEPKADAHEMLRKTLVYAIGEPAAEKAMIAIDDKNFTIEWPFWEIPEHPHMKRHWISGEAMSGEYCVVCAVFEADDEETVRLEIGARDSVDVSLKPDGWSPGDRFQ